MLQSFTYYTQFMLHRKITLYKFHILFLWNYKMMSVSCLSRSSMVLYIINNSSMYVYKHFELIFVVFTTLFTTYFDKIITTDLPKSHNPVKSVHFIQIYQLF